MKFIVSAIFCSGLLAAGCSQSPLKEESAAAGGSPAGCDSQGATACHTGTLFRCEQGMWHSTFKHC